MGHSEESSILLIVVPRSSFKNIFLSKKTICLSLKTNIFFDKKISIFCWLCFSSFAAREHEGKRKREEKRGSRGIVIAAKLASSEIKGHSKMKCDVLNSEYQNYD